MKYDISENCLEHHGILGMRWGVRRFQNKDGSLTTAGEKRYNMPQDATVIKKGSEFRRVSSSKENNKSNDRVYLTYKDSDHHERTNNE